MKPFENATILISLPSTWPIIKWFWNQKIISIQNFFSQIFFLFRFSTNFDFLDLSTFWFFFYTWAKGSWFKAFPLMTRELGNIHLGSLRYYDQVLFDFQSDFHQFQQIIHLMKVNSMHNLSAFFRKTQKIFQNISNELVNPMFHDIFDGLTTLLHKFIVKSWIFGLKKHHYQTILHQNSQWKNVILRERLFWAREVTPEQLGLY